MLNGAGSWRSYERIYMGYYPNWSHYTKPESATGLYAIYDIGDGTYHYGHGLWGTLERRAKRYRSFEKAEKLSSMWWSLP